MKWECLGAVSHEFDWPKAIDRRSVSLAEMRAARSLMLREETELRQIALDWLKWDGHGEPDLDGESREIPLLLNTYSALLYWLPLEESDDGVDWWDRRLASECDVLLRYEVAVELDLDWDEDAEWEAHELAFFGGKHPFAKHSRVTRMY